MRLYTFVHSPNPLKIRIALAELGLEHEQVEVNLFRREHHEEAFGRLNPHRKVPVLADGALVLPESNAIIAYLGEKYGGELWPADPEGKAGALRWMFFESFSLGNQCGAVWWTDVVSKAIGAPPMADGVVEEAVGDLERSLGVLDGHLAGSSYLLGESFTLPDCSVGVAVSMLRSTRLDEAGRWPNVRKYWERIQARPSWQDAKGNAIHELD